MICSWKTCHTSWENTEYLTLVSCKKSASVITKNLILYLFYLRYFSEKMALDIRFVLVPGPRDFLNNIHTVAMLDQKDRHTMQ